MENEAALAKYLEKQEKQERSLELLQDSLDNDLFMLSKEICKLQKIASQYDGYDFTEELNEWIKELI